MVSIILNAVLLMVVSWLAYRLYLVRKHRGTLAVTDGNARTITAAEVPARLTKLFSTEYGKEGATDDELEICFRYSKFHKIFDSDAYPVDAKILMHREAYLGDPTIAKELKTLITALQVAGLEFVSVYGKFAAATTQPFQQYLEQGGVPHGAWKPSPETAAKFGNGRDKKTGRFTSGRVAA